MMSCQEILEWNQTHKLVVKELNMKNLSILSLIFVLFLTACKDDVPPLGDYPSKLEGIQGNWELTVVEQRDEKIPFESQKTRDVSSVFTSVTNPTTMSFDTLTWSFTYDAGDNPALIPSGGTWAFVNTEFPEYSKEFPDQIMFEESNGFQTFYDLQSPVRPQDQYLSFRLDKNCFVDPDGIAYIFKFERVN